MRRTAGAVLGLALALGGPARAQRPEKGDPDRARALQLLEEGSAAYDRKQYQRALDDFRAAYAVYPTPKLVYNIALAELGLGQEARAAQSFQRFLDEVGRDPGSVKPEFRAAAQERLAELKGRLYVVDFTASPEGAVRYVDGEKAPGRLVYLAPGHHTLSASAEGRASRTREVEGHAGREEVVALALPPVGEARADLAPRPRDPAAEALAPAPAPSRTPAVVAFAGAGALAAAAAVLGGVTYARFRALPDNPTAYTGAASLSPAERSVRTGALVTDVLWASAAVAAGAGAVLWLTSAPPAEAP